MESHFQLTFGFHGPLASPMITCSGKGQEEVVATILGKGPMTFLSLLPKQCQNSITITMDLTITVLFTSISCYGYQDMIISTPKWQWIITLD